MGKKEEYIKEPYTVSLLMEDIQEEFNARMKDSLPISMLDKNRLKLICYLCNIDAVDYSKNNRYPQINKERIVRKIEKDLLLFGYTYFLSANPAYHYTWTYQQQKEDQYIDFICQVNRFIHYVVEDINQIVENFDLKGNVSVVFYDLFEVFLCDTGSITKVKTKLLWENLNHIMDVNREYYITIKINNAHVATKRVLYDDNHIRDIKQLFESTIKTISASKSIRESITKRGRVLKEE